MGNLRVVVLAAIFVLWTLPANADVIWPALIFEARLLSLPAILAGLAVEWVIYYFGMRLSWKETTVIDVAANGVSTLVGVLAIPIAGIVLELFPGIIFDKLFQTGTFATINWIFTYVVAVLITAYVELFVINRLFKHPRSRRNKLVVLGANATSVGLAFVSVFVFRVSM